MITDIAVGAPYEEDNHGAIYIFNGFKSGLKLSQHIKASTISHSLRGFGISIHHTHEVCNTSKKCELQIKSVLIHQQYLIHIIFTGIICIYVNRIPILTNNN